jgi:predicted nucleic acid-binding protein
MEGVFWAVQKIEKGQLRMMTSAAMRQEVITEKIGAAAEEKLTAFLDHKFVNLVGIDYSIGRLAGQIKNYYNRGPGKQPDRKMTDLDAQHLAAAIVYKVDAFYTFDEGKKGGLNLLKLNGDVMGYPLKIIKPPLPPQLEMGLNEIKEKEEKH